MPQTDLQLTVYETEDLTPLPPPQPFQIFVLFCHLVSSLGFGAFTSQSMLRFFFFFRGGGGPTSTPDAFSFTTLP